jgi:DNA end-binding protein Ku
MARPFWSGQIQLSLVSFGVKLFAATESKSQISLHEIDRRTGERIRHQNVTASRGPVDRSDIVKGYEVSKDEYVLLDAKELEQLRIPSKRTIEIRQFVEPREIDFGYFERPYFVVPENEEQATTFAVIRRAMAETGKAGLGEIAFGGREHLVALMPANDTDALGMMAYTLRYPDELRDAGKIFPEMKNSKIAADQLSLAKELIRRNSARFDASKFKDDYEAALREAIEAKVNHKTLPRQSTSRGKIINLTDALRRSLDEKTGKQNAGARGKPARTASGSARRDSGRKGPVLVPSARRRRKTA